MYLSLCLWLCLCLFHISYEGSVMIPGWFIRLREQIFGAGPMDRRTNKYTDEVTPRGPRGPKWKCNITLEAWRVFCMSFFCIGQNNLKFDEGGKCLTSQIFFLMMFQYNKMCVTESKSIARFHGKRNNLLQGVCFCYFCCLVIFLFLINCHQPVLHILVTAKWQFIISYHILHSIKSLFSQK